MPTVVVATFGPYLVGAIKLDQVVVYGALLFALGRATIRRHFSGPMLAVVTAWVMLIVLAMVQVPAAPPNPTAWGPGSWVANLDGHTLSLAVLLIVVSVVRPESWQRVVGRVTAAVTVAMSVNAVLAIVSSTVSIPWLSLWWSSTPAVGTTADRAATVGRFAGLLNQPAEAGVLYSVAGICALYWLRERPPRLAIALLLLTAGGFVAVSKAFIFVGLPAILWQMLRHRGRRGRRLATLAATAGIAWMWFGAAAVRGWAGADQFLRQIPGWDVIGNIDVLTGNRYGDGSGLDLVVEPTMQYQPWFGFGMRGVGKATDAGWVQALSIAGLAGVAALTVVILGLLVGYMKVKSRLLPAERGLFAGVLFVVVATSMGFPTLTGNRVAVVVWALLGLMLAAHELSSERPADNRRLHSSPGNVPPIEYEQAHYAALNQEPPPV